LIFYDDYLRLEFEKDIEALQEALSDTDTRIKKLEEHKKSEEKKLGQKNSETLRRLEKNLETLQKKRTLILSELKNDY
jgi:lipid II:glycine glycyltransferase (peptidoglycan interpeptide bridge formation enzyme)